MKKTALFVFCVLAAFVKAQTGLVWAKSFTGNTASSECYATSVDGSGNVYTFGEFNGVVDFDPGPSTFTLNTTGNWDVFVTKLDAAGNFLWVKQMGGTQGDYSMDMKLDAVGNIYVVGEFEGTSDFDPGPGITNLTSTGSTYETYIVKLDPNGNFIWAKHLGGDNWCNVRSITVEGNSNLYVTGAFGGTVDFDPGPSTFTMTDGGNGNVYISKLDAAGNFVWAKQITGTSGALAMSITFNGVNDIYATGRYSGTQDFDPGMGAFNMTSTLFWDIFILKLDVSGNFVWAKSLGGTNYDIGIDITTDASGNVYTTGNFYDTVDFDPGPGTFTLSTSVQDVFVLKLDAAGNFLFAKNFSGSVKSIALDATNNIYTSGGFIGTVDFDPGSGTNSSSSVGSYDIYISKLDPSGNFLWATPIGGTGLDNGLNVIVDPAGNIYTCGYFSSIVDFDSGPLTYTLNGQSSTTGFVHKMNSSVGTEEYSKTVLVSAFPNPNTGYFALKLEEAASVKLTNSLGIIVYQQELSNGKHDIDIQNIGSSVYYLTVTPYNKPPITKVMSITK
jgi:hypothetical protein